MKKTLLFITVLMSSIVINAQSYTGYYHDNYAGVQSVLFNPASIADSRFKTDVNLFSVGGSIGNDLYGVKWSQVFKSGYDFDTQASNSSNLTNNGILNIDVMGPSFMFNIAPKHSIAVFTRARSLSNLMKINGDLVDKIKDGLDESSSFNLNAGSPNIATNSWAEFGVSYAAVLYESGEHFVKGGLTFKYLQGGMNAYLQGDNVQVAFVGDVDDRDNSVLTTNGRLTIGASQDWEENEQFDFNANSKGLGMDLGFVYEWRPDYPNYSDPSYAHLNKYKLRFGLSLTDIGSVNYKNTRLDTYQVNGSVTNKQIEDAENLYDFLNEYYTHVSSAKGVKAKLPAALHADVDWNIHNKFYVNLNSDISMVKGDKINGIQIADRISLTPRYESKWFTYNLPITYMEYSGMQVGSGVRVGAFFIGSGSVLSNLVSSKSKAADFYLGIKIPVYQKAKIMDGEE
jgi:hypothetical protein